MVPYGACAEALDESGSAPDMDRCMPNGEWGETGLPTTFLLFLEGDNDQTLDWQTRTTNTTEAPNEAEKAFSLAGTTELRSGLVIGAVISGRD